MSELDARYARGQDTRRLFGGGTITSAGSVPGAWEVAPDLERILGEALFGTIWHRDALSPVQREMITLSTLIVLARGLCRKFSFEAICGMVSPSDPCCQGGERRWRFLRAQ